MFEMLAKQYEVAKLDENKAPGIIQILDAAVAPDHKSSPHRTVIVVLSAMIAFLMTALWFALGELFGCKYGESRRAEQLRAICSALQGW
jgi:uncharacterized protein involved in exopolysaccharide biosynthesis